MKKQIKQAFAKECPVASAMKHLGGKWKFAIIWQLYQADSYRYGELRRLIPKITERVFIQQLKEMEGSGLIERKSFQEIPPRVEYSLTKVGKELIPVIISLSNWSRKNGFHPKSKNSNT